MESKSSLFATDVVVLMDNATIAKLVAALLAIALLFAFVGRAFSK